MTPARRSPRFVPWLIARLVPRDEREFFLGDLEERQPSSWPREVRGALSLALAARGRQSRQHKRTGGPLLAGVIQDLRHAFRVTRRSPGFAAAAIVTLAVAIGATTAVFSVVDAVLIAPLPYRNAGRLVAVQHTMSNVSLDAVPLAPGMYFTFRDHARTLEEVALWKPTRVTVTGLSRAEQVETLQITDRLFSVLGIDLRLGRGFTEADVSPGSARPVILSHGYWTRRFGRDPGVLGRTLRVNGEAREIVGVTPAGLWFPDDDPQIFVPLVFDRTRVTVGNFSYPAVARLGPGVSIGQADAELDSLTPVATEEYGGGNSLENLRARAFTSFVRPLKQDIVGGASRTLWIVFGTVGVVLLIACVNVAHLFLVRAEARRRDLALRAALGASRVRLAREWLAESLIVGGSGGAAGVLLAAAGLRGLVALAPASLPRLDTVGLDWRALVFATGVSIATALVFGAVALVSTGTTSLDAALRTGGRGTTGSTRRPVTRLLFGASQVAMAMVLLVAAGLMARTFAALLAVPPGFEAPAEVLTFRIAVPSSEAPRAEDVALIHRTILDDLGGLPGVVSVGAAASVAMDTWDSWDSLLVEDAPLPDHAPAPHARMNWIAADYFETLRDPVLAGRVLRWDDSFGRRPVVLVTENLARKYWGDPARAIGRRVRNSASSPWRSIIGVVGDVRTRGVTEDAPLVVYYPLITGDLWGSPSFTMGDLRYAVRVTGSDPRAVLPAILEIVRQRNPNLAVADVLGLDQIFFRSIARTSFVLVMLALAGGIALLLGVVGAYSVIAYLVSRRTHELGVRLALGATRAEVGLMVLRQGAVIAAAGVVLGVACALAVTRLMSTLLFGVSAVDPITYGVLGLLLGGVVLAASGIPAHRAARVDPILALRSE